MSTNDIKDIADAIRTKTGDSNKMTLNSMVTAVNTLSNAQDGEAIVLGDIVDEVNLKTGLNDTNVSSEQLVLDIASIATNVKDAPDYVRDEAERVAAIVKTLQTDKSVSFIAITDSHIGTSAQSIESVTHAAQGAGIIAGMVPIDFTAILGDTVTGSAGDNLQTHLGNLINSLRALAPAAPTLRLVGNHDANPYNASSFIAAKDVYNRIGRFTTAATKPNNETDRGYFYYDIEDKSMRVICLNSADMKDANINALTEYQSDGHHISAKQFEWLIGALDMTGKNGWNVIILSHHPLHWYGSMPKVLTILDAYVAGSSGNITADSTTVSYNFAGKNAAKLIGTFHGHTHNFISGKVGTADIVRVGTPNACYGGNNSYGSSSYTEDFRSKYGEVSTYGKTAKSAKDTSFCVYTIDTEAEVIHATCYGAGYDRTVSYGGSEWYTVTSNLTGVFIDNITASIEGGTAYMATLSVGKNYTINNVVITMGGVDVTKNVYANGVINIPQVTGNIVIIATASGFTNLIDTIGYDQNVRLSTSSGDNRDATGYVTTGYIDLTNIPDSTSGIPFIVRATGADFRTANNNLCCYVWYKADKSFHNAGYLNVYSSGSFGISFDDDGGVTFAMSRDPEVGYVRLTGYGNGEDLIVTLNEEIADPIPDSGVDVTNYTNKIYTSITSDGSVYNWTGYKSGYRISTSSGNESAASSMTVTGFIPITSGKIVRVKDIDLTSGDSTYGIYNSSFAKDSTGYCNTLFSTADANGVRKWTATFTGYIRISGAFGDNPIITVDEEIV